MCWFGGGTRAQKALRASNYVPSSGDGTSGVCALASASALALASAFRFLLSLIISWGSNTAVGRDSALKDALWEGWSGVMDPP